MKKDKAETQLAKLVLTRPTLTSIAREADVSVSFVSAGAAGRKKASPKVRAAAAIVLGLPTDVIFPDTAAA